MNPRVHTPGGTSGRAVPVPADLIALLDQTEKRLNALAAENPLAALRATVILESLAKQAATDAAISIDTPDGPTWDTIAQGLGISEQTARSRLTRYTLGR
ncbi:hypothetical protein ACIODT_37250 [Streptomyces sp. NPDC088251]|uniref:hypothetical protein n=1 Tax=unclassified Streptomyces TaxID=2593676 RepID=UPI00382C1885